MRTEISKSFSWGFVATEQDFRRLIQTATDHLLKPSGASLGMSQYEVRLEDGSVFQTAQFDDVFQLENAGNKIIREVSCSLSSSHPGGECTINVELKDGNTNKKNWDSATYRVSGDTRDWAFVAASDLDERLKRMKAIAWESIFAQRWPMTVIMLAGMPLSIFGSFYFKPKDTTHVQLQSLYAEGKLANPTEAIIALEKIKASRSEIDTLWPLFVMWGGLLAIYFCCAFVLPKLSPSYNFCWGEYTAQYGKRVRLRNALFTLVVISLVVSVLANFVSKKLGF
ncbi:MAG: hypothetical protein ACKVZJ_03465 [Phycisphaerales bacterium]